VAELTFYIIPNKPKTIDTEEATTPILIDNEPAKRGISIEPAIRGISSESAELIKKWQVSKKSIDAWLSEFGIEQVTKAIKYTQRVVEKGEIKNPAGYLNKMVRESNLDDQETERKKAIAEKKRLQEELKIKRAQIDEKIKIARRENYEDKIALVRKVLVENPIIKTQIFNQVKARYAHLFREGESDISHYDIDRTTIRPKVNQIIFEQYADLFRPIDEKLKLDLSRLDEAKRVL
jgi:uncharacterized protein (DUF433 family)